MKYAYAVFALLSGLGAFLIGVKLLSDNTERLAGNRIKDLFNKTSKSKLVGVGIGTVATAVIQSSSLTTVMVVGFVNAGIMSLAQATTVIMGANIGTTITAQIAALQSFSFSAFAAGFAGLGVLVALFTRKEKITAVGYAFAGLGLVFVGLDIMADAMTVVKESAAVTELLTNINNPFLLFFIGIALTALVQSSSAVTSIIISMATAGMIIGNGGNSVLYVILGTNIGTCVTALISSIGASPNAKRAAIIHLLFNVIGSVIFFILLVSWRSFMDVTFAKWFPHPSTQIAMFHTFFNVTCTLLFLPFTKVFVKMSELIIRDKTRFAVSESTLLDKRFLVTPPIAAEAAAKETADILRTAANALDDAVNGFIEKSDAAASKVDKSNSNIAKKSQQLTEYLIKISASGGDTATEKLVSTLHSSLGDAVRVGELAENITKYTARAIKNNMHFSPIVKESVTAMMNSITELANISSDALINRKSDMTERAEELENGIDEMRKSLIKDHIDRLNKGECKAENSGVFINLVSNLERAGDHLTYIARAFDGA